RVAVVRSVRGPATSNAVGNQNNRAPKRAHPMSLHQRRIHYHGNIDVMPIARTRLTAQGQVSIPAEVRRRLGLTAGSVVEWDADGDRVFVRRVGKYTSEDIHRAIFPDGPPRKISIKQMDEAIGDYMRHKYARR